MFSVRCHTASEAPRQSDFRSCQLDDHSWAGKIRSTEVSAFCIRKKNECEIGPEVKEGRHRRSSRYKGFSEEKNPSDHKETKFKCSHKSQHLVLNAVGQTYGDKVYISS
jgi:hypothetical protein